MNEIEHRKNFEEWLPDLSPMDSFIDKQGNFRYSDSLVQACWLGYQAALSQQPAAEWMVMIQRTDAQRLLISDENSPGYQLSRRRVEAALAARPNFQKPLDTSEK